MGVVDWGFLADDRVLDGFVAANRSRAGAAGLDPHHYDEVVAGVGSLREWPAAFATAAHAEVDRAQAAGRLLRRVSAGQAWRAASLLFHFSTILPNPDLTGHAEASRAAAVADRSARELLEPKSIELRGEGYVAVLRQPIERPPSGLVVLLPGMNSARIEFDPVSHALTARGLAVVAVDGPGQGELAPGLPWDADYHLVVRRVIDRLHDRVVDVERRAVLAMSFGGCYGGLVAVDDPDLAALAVISGPSAIDFDEVPPYVRETFVLRTGSEAAARRMAARADVRDRAPGIGCPVLVVEGSTDVTPGVTNGLLLADLAPRSQSLVVPGGNHLIENARWQWVPAVADWLAGHLSTPGQTPAS
jgi:pimeloyl-ACP methyl ester carboxylesterase